MIFFALAPAFFQPKKRAFTLVEILVVIAIVCLLAAILFPVFGRVREAGRRTTCASNLKQIGMALNQYAQDNRFYPLIDFNAYINGQSGAWAEKVFPYVKADKVFECPSSRFGLFRSGCPPTDKSDPDHPISWNGSYNLNIRDAKWFRDPVTGTYTGAYKPLETTSPTRYTRPASTILVLDGDGGFVSPGYQEPPALDVATLQNYGVPDRHEGGVNVAFADGHVKWMSLDSLLKLSLWRINGPE